MELRRFPEREVKCLKKLRNESMFWDDLQEWRVRQRYRIWCCIASLAIDLFFLTPCLNFFSLLFLFSYLCLPWKEIVSWVVCIYVCYSFFKKRYSWKLIFSSHLHQSGGHLKGVKTMTILQRHLLQYLIIKQTNKRGVEKIFPILTTNSGLKAVEKNFPCSWRHSA